MTRIQQLGLLLLMILIEACYGKNNTSPQDDEDVTDIIKKGSSKMTIHIPILQALEEIYTHTARKQCEHRRGTCIESGAHCDYIIDIIHISDNDHCCCCLPTPPEPCDPPTCTYNGTDGLEHGFCSHKENIPDGWHNVGEQQCTDGCCCWICPLHNECKERGGFCIENGDRCDGIIEIIDNSGDDHCCCCLPIPPGSCVIKGRIYPSGKKFIRDCMNFTCSNGKWYSSNNYEYECATCSIRNDPHFTTFDDLKFDWHGHSTYVLSQKFVKGECPYCPEVVVASSFIDCVSGLPWATCIHTFYFQPEPGTFIKIEKASPPISSPITIDSFTQYLSGGAGEMTILKGYGGEEHPAFAWISGDCIYIMGFEDHGYLLEICSYFANLYAPPTLWDNVCGLCGNYDGDKMNDIMFRDGTTMTPPPQPPPWNYVNLQVTPNYGNSWVFNITNKAPECIVPCPEIEIEWVQPESPCADYTPEKIEPFILMCKERIEEVLPVEKALQFINDCAFDLCVASGNNTLEKIWLNEIIIMVRQIEKQPVPKVGLKHRSNHCEDNNGVCMSSKKCNKKSKPSRYTCSHKKDVCCIEDQTTPEPVTTDQTSPAPVTTDQTN